MAEAGKASPLRTEDVFRDHGHRVARWVQILGGAGFDVEDVVQEVFLIVHARLDRFRGDAKLTTWLYALTANVLRQRRRKERVRRLARGLGWDVNDERSHEDTPHEKLERQQAVRRVQRILDTLPEKYRTPLVLFEVEGLSGEEIAELTDTKLRTVWVRLHRARAGFLKALKESQRDEACHEG
jgi:RNA polymerase sigma-70 factor, ECF subfamily